MNRVYQVVWNTSKGVFQAVSELSRRNAGGKSSASGALSSIAAGTLFLFVLPLHAANLPTGGEVVGGQGNISSSGNTLTVNQNSQNLAINWQDFSIAEGHTVNFVQPNAQAAALNRVTGNNVSDIRGAINANGRVFLVNPNGVMFSSTAKVDVGALVASTLDISTSDFMAGNYSFAGASSNAIINLGNITAAAGGYVAMIAARIINTGTINTPQGSTLMGAGSKVTLDLGGPVKIEVEEALLNTYIEQGGAIKADGGLVYLTAKAAGELASSIINHTGITEARTLAAGKDGRIMLMGDMEHGQMQVAGTLDASAPNGSDGGFIETSAAHVDITNDVFVTTKASSGKTGEWLIDPVDIAIAATGGNVTGATIANALQSTDVTLDTSGSGSCSGTSCSGLSSGNGDIFLNDDIKVTGGNADTTLTFKANRNIIVDQGKEISSASGKLNTVFWADVDNTDGGMIWMKNDSIINTNGGHLWMGGGSGSTTWNGLTVGGGRAIGNDVNSNGIVLIRTNLATNGGNMAFYGRGRPGNYSSISTGSPNGPFSNSNGIRLESGNTIDAGSGTIHFDGYTDAVAAAGSANGIELSAFQADRISSSSDADTAIFINGRANNNAGAGNSWGFYSWLAQIESSGAGGIYIQGSGAKNAGVTIASGTSIQSESGNITLEGLGSGAADPSDVLIEGSLRSKSGDINLVANSLDISGTLASTGALNIRTRSADRPINIGGSDASALEVDGAYFSSNFADDFSSITIGDEHSDTITVGGAVDYRDDLILKSGKNIILNGLANMTGAVDQNASLTLWSRVGGNQEATDNRIGSVWLAEGSGVNTNGGDIVIGGGTDPLTGNAKGDTTGSAEGNAISRGVSINGTLDAGGGGINIRGRGRPGGFARGVSIAGDVRTEGSGNISIHGYASGGSDAIAIGDGALTGHADGSISAGTGTVYLAGQRGSGNSINLNNGSSITSSGKVVLNGLADVITSGGSDFITADELLIINASRAALGSNQNDISTLAANDIGSGGLHVTDKDELTIGVVDWNSNRYAGIEAAGAIDIATVSGSLNINENVSTSSTANNAITLNAARSEGAGTAGGGDIQVSGATISTGTGGRATLYTGSISGSTGMTDLIGSGSGRFRYNSDEVESGYTTALGAGLYAIYREQPTLLINADSQSISYGSSLPSYTIAYTGFANGDSSADLTGTAAWDLEAGATSNSGNRVVGSYDVSYSGGLDNGLGYVIADNISSAGTLTITKRVLDLELAGTSSRVYDGTTSMDFSGYTVSAIGMISGDDFAIGTDSLVGVVDKNVGTDKQVTFTGFGLSGIDAGNYELVSGGASSTASITQKAITISGISAADKFYDAGTLATVDVSAASGWVSGDDVQLSATGAFADKHADADKTVTLTSSYSGSDVANYVITDQASTTADINRLAITVSGITAEDRVYDGTTDATVSSANASGWLAGDDVQVSATGQFADKNADTNKAVVLTSSYSGSDVANYDITDQASTTADINRLAITVSGITAEDRIYDGTTDATVSSANASGWLANDDVQVSATGQFADKNADTNKAVVLTSSYSGSDVANYVITDQANTTADIDRLAITVSGITAEARVYDGTTDATVSSANASGWLAGDDVQVSATGQFADKNADTNKAVVLTSSYSGSDVANYVITDQASTTADIDRLAITVSGITAEARVYDGTTDATVSSANASGWLAGDDVQLSATGAFADKHADADKTVTLTSSYSGSDVANYVITDQANTTADIDRLAITVSGITAEARVYNGTTDATVSSANASGWVSGDDVQLSATGAFADKHADADKTVTLTSSYSGSDVANYVITDQASTTADINRLAITVSGITAEARVYDGTTDATVSSANASGWLAGDDVQVSATGQFADKNAGANKNVNLSSSYSGDDVRNYLIISQDSTAASVTSRAVTVAADNLEKDSGAADPALTYQTSCGVLANDCGLVGGESLAGELRRDPGEASGSYAIRQGTLNESSNPNYAITFEEGHLLIAELDAPAGGGEVPASSSNQISQLIAAIYSAGSRGNSAPAASLEFVDVSGTETALASVGQQSGNGPLRLLVVDGGLRQRSDDIYPNQD